MIKLCLAPSTPDRCRDDAWALTKRALSSLVGEGFAVARTAVGKPFIAGHEVRFSLSHAEELVACCVSRDRDVGVDVEPLASGVRVLRMAEDVLTERERASLPSRLGRTRADRAAKLWTMKEAYVKAYGTTIGDVDPAMLGFALDRGRARLDSSGVGPAAVRVLVVLGHAISVVACGSDPFDLQVRASGFSEVPPCAAPSDRPSRSRRAGPSRTHAP